MNELNYDAVVIGSGNGGLIAALRLAKSSKKVLLALIIFLAEITPIPGILSKVK